MPSILILTDSFTPDFSPRVSCLVRNLIKDGYSVTVLAEDVENPFYGIDVTGAEVYSYKFYRSKPKTFIRQIEWAAKATLNLIFDYKSHWFRKKCTKAVGDRRFDAVLCSTFCYFPLKCAWRMAHGMGVPFITDIRDLSEQFASLEYQQHSVPLFGKLYDKVMRKRRNRYIRLASSVITVSPWHKEFLERLNGNVSLIYNGYDPSMFHYEEVRNPVFDIVFTGRRWVGRKMQDPYPLFEALESMLSSGALPVDKVRLMFFLSTGREEMRLLLKKFPNCLKISNFGSRIPFNEMPQLINSSSVVAVLSNKSSDDGPKGIMTTRFFEALGCEKPVLNVAADNSYLEAAINETGAGIAASSADDVKPFLIEKFSEWERNGYTHQHINLTKAGKFDRSYQTKQFEEILNR